MTIRADRVTLDGMSGYGWQIRNSWGRLLVLLGDDITVRHVMCQFSYQGPYGARAAHRHGNCANIRSGAEYFARIAKKDICGRQVYRQHARASGRRGRCAGMTMRLSTGYCSLSGGEGSRPAARGICVSSGASPTTHKPYCSSTTSAANNAVIDSNVMWFDMVNGKDFLTHGQPPDNIAIGDEEALSSATVSARARRRWSARVIIGGDVGIAADQRPQLRTTIKDLYIGFKYHQGTPSRKAVQITQPGADGPHGGVIGTM